MSYQAVQSGVLAIGTPRNSYLEYDLTEAGKKDRLSAVMTALEAVGGTTPIAGAQVVIGFRPELWARLGRPAIKGLTGYNQDIVGPDGFTMPATQHDLILWVQGAQQDSVFDVSRDLSNAVAEYFELVDSTDGWVYQHNRDLTGFVDGTENPAPAQIPEIIQDPETGGSVLLVQKWPHEVEAWEGLSQEEQEAVMGRTKDTDVELEDRPENSHVARNDQEDVGDILRRNTAFGGAKEHGTMFIGVAAKKEIMQTMLERMAGLDGGPRDALTRFSHADTGAYYYLPPVTEIIVPEDEEDED
ncbi:hypothetical protein BSR29_07270 [Boudabousia liubingyangii]|uniref:Dyp-type peroxidase n=1 Tax=Boudabousia liubingyangii TaxID=1921764 RepID=A0A1Q5PK72_9ACTO|nr:Dyp-type peroxidase [Boudabousia liubingyangii]OKL46613.1 hypothetical protein BSR29_07270 [Boudabousia liubingyangii]OKL46798.1 hypothetical protein BSR28_04995 [Boudabousia liubingyangii]